jgi:uncharacterized membrane protein (UPF0127 family)
MPTTYSLHKIGTESALVDSVAVAEGIFQRIFGMIGKRNLQENWALLIPECQRVHSFFMDFPLDIIFCSSDEIIVGTVESLKPWSLSPKFPTASYAIELPKQSISRFELQIGDKIELNIK